MIRTRHARRRTRVGGSSGESGWLVVLGEMVVAVLQAVVDALSGGN